jgi:hypothetical protein
VTPPASAHVRLQQPVERHAADTHAPRSTLVES